LGKFPKMIVVGRAKFKFKWTFDPQLRFKSLGKSSKNGFFVAITKFKWKMTF
jgi:hypothetical protein